MPDVDGLEVCSAPAAHRESGVPILMLTAADQQPVSDRIEGLDAGAESYIVKPFDVDELKGAPASTAASQPGRRGDLPPELLTFEELQLDSARYGALVGIRFLRS